jgi:bacterial/archaeal transporter family protein
MTRLQKFTLLAHITFSVGWFGAVVPYLALAIAALTSREEQMVRAACRSMEFIGWFVVVPFSLAALLSGLVQSFGTRWGLFRHWWIVAKLILNHLHRNHPKNMNTTTNSSRNKSMNTWFWYAVGAALLYGLHQIFTKLASAGISDGIGGLVVEGTAALTILVYLIYLRTAGSWNQSATAFGIWYSVLTGICVGSGTILFFVLFQKGGPLSAVPMILAGGAALMATAGILFFHEPISFSRIVGIVLAITGLLLMRK